MPVKFPILGININPLAARELLSLIDEAIVNHKKTAFFYANAHAIVLANENPGFKQCINNADYVYCDGFGVRFAAQILSYPPPPRITPPDWISCFFQYCCEKRKRVFFLGAEQNVIEKAVKNVREEYQNIDICGFHHGYFDKSTGSLENNEMVKLINESCPDILVIGFGMPSQELWIEENKSDLNPFVFLPVGALFDHLSGNAKRLPKWMTDHGFEWLGRLFFEPKRLWNRYLIGLPKYFILLLVEFFRKFKMEQ